MRLHAGRGVGRDVHARGLDASDYRAACDMGGRQRPDLKAQFRILKNRRPAS